MENQGFGTVTVRKAEERGRADFGWLESRHTFSFGEYHDPRHMGFRSLRVINDDRVSGAGGFPSHPHRDMEIVSYVVEGAMAHRDSSGGDGSVIHAGDVQRMSAGKGITHSEFNHSKTDAVHFLQIWILPEQRGLEPGYEQKSFPDADKKGRLCLIASRDGRDGSLTVHQDADIYAGRFDRGESAARDIAPGRGVWVQVVNGQATVNDVDVAVGDGVAIEGASRVHITGRDNAEILLFDLA